MKLDDKLVAQAKEQATAAGFDSPQAYIEHILRQEFAKGPATVKEESEIKEDTLQKMEELGYLDEGADI